MTGIAMVIPSIPVRTELLMRALQSVVAQTILPSQISVAFDCDREGAGPTRTRALRAATGAEWVAFMDDDDTLLEHHLETLYCTALEQEADVVWPWFRVVGGSDPIACNRGKQWDSANPHTFPITALVRNELAQQCYFPKPLSGHGCSGEDFDYWMQLDRLGAKFHHIATPTWNWHHGDHNSAGMPNRW